MSTLTSALFVSEFGAGRPMLALHGIESHGARFLRLAASLDGVRVVAPDLRGHGRSPKVGPWTIDRAVADLRPVLHRLAGGNHLPLLLGHSYGGLLAWELARASPGLVGGLVLVDPAINVSAEMARASTAYDASTVERSWPGVADAFAEFARDRPESGVWSAALDAAVGVERGSDGRYRTLVVAEAVTAGWQQMNQPLRSTPYRGSTLVLEAGREHGRFCGPHVVAAMREQLGDTLDHVVLDVTHPIPSDYPDELAAAVRAFLAHELKRRSRGSD